MSEYNEYPSPLSTGCRTSRKIGDLWFARSWTTAPPRLHFPKISSEISVSIE